MGSAKGAGRVVLRTLGWTPDERVSQTRWLVEALVWSQAWLAYVTGIVPGWQALTVACLLSAVYGVSWASRIHYRAWRPRGSAHRRSGGAHRRNAARQ
ncbi:hypothetical protein [Streptomyces sp. G45]|uniref:hypothetical protein n=1 Tax=Streptomyces sp. G45 TaxID=3406627 RepID=UPI003C141F1E